MTKPFGATSTTDDVLAGVDLHGKRVLVTGVSAGLGVETARALAAHGAEVVGTARDVDKAAQANAAAGTDSARLRIVQLDLAALASVRACADALVKEARPFDLVIANAGVMATPFGQTADGFETQLGTNHLGHFVFINRIAGLVRDGGRIVMVSSSGHRYANVDLEDPGFTRTAYDPFVAYGRSKTANILFAVELDRRLTSRGVRATAIHPGGIQTELGRHLPANAIDGMVEKINEELAGRGEPAFRWKTVPQGAATSVWAGVVAGGEQVGAHFCENCQVSTPTDAPIGPVSPGVRPYALDGNNAKALWKKSEEMVGERFADPAG